MSSNAFLAATGSRSVRIVTVSPDFSNTTSTLAGMAKPFGRRTATLLPDLKVLVWTGLFMGVYIPDIRWGGKGACFAVILISIVSPEFPEFVLCPRNSPECELASCQTQRDGYQQGGDKFAQWHVPNFDPEILHR